MKFLIFALLTFGTVIACAQSSDNRIVEGSYFPNAFVQKNYVKNATCDKNVNDIAVTGSMTKTATATNRIKGVKSCGIDASASAEVATWSLFPQEAEWNGQNCEAKFSYIGDGTLYQANVLVGTNPQVASVTLINTGTDKQLVSMNFPCPASGGSAASVVLASTGNGAAITVDDVYVGISTNVGDVGAVSAWIPFTPTGTWVTNTTYTGRWRKVGDTAEIEWHLALTGAPTNTSLGLTLPTGLIIDTAKSAGAGLLPKLNRVTMVSAGNTYNGVVLPNSTSAVLVRYINSPTAPAATSNLSATLPATFTSGDSVTVTATFPIVGWSASAQAINPALTSAYYQGYHDNTCSWSLTSTSYTNYTADATCALVDGPKSNISAAVVGATRPGLALTLPKIGIFYVCATASFYGSVAGGHGHRLWDGTTEIATGTETNAAETDTIPLCGLYANTSLTPTLEIQSNAGAGSQTLQAQRGNNARAIQWTIIDVTQNFPAPVLVNSITSNSLFAERVERLIFGGAGSTGCTSSPCEIKSQSGSWVTSVTRGSTGAYTVNIATGIFSAVPTCVCGGANITTGPGSCIINPFTSTATSLVLTSKTNAGGNLDDAFHVHCMGPR